jgi:hypothetical protein
MRTTLAIEDDALAAAKAIARHEHKSLGEVVTDLIRKALHASEPSQSSSGLPVFARREGVVVDLEIVNALRDETP